MKRVTALKPRDGFRLWLRFSDGVEGEADLSDLVDHGVFTAWNRPGAFAQAKVTKFGAVTWENEIDLCPDTLYLRILGNSPAGLFSPLRETAIHA